MFFFYDSPKGKVEASVVIQGVMLRGFSARLSDALLVANW